MATIDRSILYVSHMHVKSTILQVLTQLLDSTVKNETAASA